MSADKVEVHCDYISAAQPIHKAFPATATMAEVKSWAQAEFAPNPPSDKMFYLTDDKTRHRFTQAEEQQSLHDLGYEHVAHLRLNEEQISG